jgi:translocation protein SEC62
MLMSGRAVLRPTAKQDYDGLEDKKGRYVWLYTGESSWWVQYLPYIILFGILAVCMFPLWPIWLRKAVFWASVAFLVVFTVFLVIRYTVALLAWLVGFEFWIFPRFWDDSASVMDSFRPALQMGRDPEASDYLLYRLAVLGCLASLAVWGIYAPEDVSSLWMGQAKLMEDLYSGALMQQASEVRLPGQDHKFGARNSWNGQDAPRVRAFDDIWADLDKAEEGGRADEKAGGGAAAEAAATEGGEAAPAPSVEEAAAEEAADMERGASLSDEEIMAEMAAEAAAQEDEIGRGRLAE